MIQHVLPTCRTDPLPGRSRTKAGSTPAEGAGKSYGGPSSSGLSIAIPASPRGYSGRRTNDNLTASAFPQHAAPRLLGTCQ